jgi:cobyrinic acid a,c-diamide synthase
LQAAGAELIDIDPCRDTALPEIDALFIGGGFPETHMQELENNVAMRTAIKAAIDDDLPTYAECGGLMYLARSIEWHGMQCAMVGCIDADIIMEKRPQGRGYVQLQETENNPWPPAANPEHSCPGHAHIINAHEFHYSRFKIVHKNVKFAFKVKRGTGIDGKSDGYVYKNLLATYTHQRNTRNNPWTKRFVDFARMCKAQRQSRN